MDIESIENNLQLLIELEKNPSNITLNNLMKISLKFVNKNDELNPMSLKYKKILELSMAQSIQTFEIQCAQKEAVQELEIDNKDKLDDLIGILNERITNITNFIK